MLVKLQNKSGKTKENPYHDVPRLKDIKNAKMLRWRAGVTDWRFWGCGFVSWCHTEEKALVGKLYLISSISYQYAASPETMLTGTVAVK